MPVRLLYITVPKKEEANRIAETLVTERLAACANILGPGTSVFRWEGKIVAEDECVTIIKTTDAAAAQARQRIIDLHPYDLPCILEIAPSDGHQDFLNWITTEVRK